MELTTAAAALGIVEKVSKGLNSVRERAKTSKDADLKERISSLYDDFLDLREVTLRLTEENAELRSDLATKCEKLPTPEIQQIGQTNYYFVGEKGPYCQPCYDEKGKLMMLSPQRQQSGGVYRHCSVCGQVFTEVPAVAEPPREYNPYGWMR